MPSNDPTVIGTPAVSDDDGAAAAAAASKRTATEPKVVEVQRNKEEGEGEGEERAKYLSNHTISMRSALRECCRLFEERSGDDRMARYLSHRQDDEDDTTDTTDPPSGCHPEDAERRGHRREKIVARRAKERARNIRSYRRESLENFRRQRRFDTDENCGEDNHTIPTMNDLGEVTYIEFRRRFQQANIPVKIIGNKNAAGNERGRGSGGDDGGGGCGCGLRDYFGRLDDTMTVQVGNFRKDEDQQPPQHTDRNGDVAPPASARNNGSSRAAAPRNTTTRKARATVNRRWFLDALGADAIVPVRVSPAGRRGSTKDENALDAGGRANECETEEMTVRQYIRILDRATASEEDPSPTVRSSAREDTGTKETDDSRQGPNHPTNGLLVEDLNLGQPSNPQRYYLKDWHLISWLRQRDPKYVPLYTVPKHFGVDVLNRFLTKFSNDAADYYFCYWGPPDSVTSIHSDVMNSFSWSYNVSGVKEWTFFLPSSASSSSGDAVANREGADRNRLTDTKSFVVRQYAGECMFVPAGWKHHVVNVEETLSINHNWITAANIDLVWDCICSEMIEVDRELAKWDVVDASDMEGRELMLRGCVGLDATAFFFMIVYGILDIGIVLDTRNQKEEEEEEERMFDLYRLADMLQVLYDDQHLQLLDRLSAVLQNSDMAQRAFDLGTKLLQLK